MSMTETLTTQAADMDDTKTFEVIDPASVNPDDYTVYVAEITGAHGVSGNVRIRPIGTADVAIKALQSVGHVLAVTPDKKSWRILTPMSMRRQPGPKGAWIARFRESVDRPHAESLYGLQLFVLDNQRPALPEGEYYIDQVIGCVLETETGKPLGTLTQILESPAHDVYVTDLDVMVPVVSAFIVSTDLDAKRIVVRDIPGLLGEA